MQTNWYEDVNAFDELNLKSDLLRGIYAYGYERPSAIQRRTILPILKGLDIIAQGQSGTGKSASFIIPSLQLIDEDLQECQAIILVPTQDLAKQLFHVSKCLAEYLKIKVHVCDSSYSRGNKVAGAQVVFGTADQVLKLINMGYIEMNMLRIVVLDEADELLGGSEKEKTKEIFGYINSTVQKAMFSTTMPEDILEVAGRFTIEPVMVLMRNEDLILDRTIQFYVMVEKEEMKAETLVEILEGINVQQMIIYCNSKGTVDKLGEYLAKKDFHPLKIDNTMEFADRDRAVKKFRTGECRMLITTDILSRGIDIQHVSLVVNYDLPQKKEDYIHRIGRCNRFSKRGYAFSLVTSEEAQYVKEIEEYYSTRFDLLEDLSYFD